MPEADPELREIMGLLFKNDGISDIEPHQFLTERGYRLTREWEWELPSASHSITWKELLCIQFLCDEWDFGGIVGQRPLSSTTEGPR